MRNLILIVRDSLPRRWAIFFSGILILALIGLFPLRAAIGLSDFRGIGFSARQVAGTIWYGRIGELQLRSQPFGTFEVSLNPVPLLIGNVSMAFNRMDSPEGVLNGKLVAGFRRGLVDTSGRIAVGEMFAPLPIEALELSNVTLLFRGGSCSEAKGTVTAIVNSPVPGMSFGGLSGKIECDGERARVRMGAAGTQKIEFYVQSNGRYRGWMNAGAASPEISAALASAGFRPSPQGMSLTVDGQL